MVTETAFEGRCARCQQPRRLFKWTFTPRWNNGDIDLWLCPRCWSDTDEESEEPDEYGFFEDWISDLAAISNSLQADTVVTVSGGTR